ncbi:hypothetical protein OROGR_009411 [Orobanche gracilis]
MTETDHGGGRRRTTAAGGDGPRRRAETNHGGGRRQTTAASGDRPRRRQPTSATNPTEHGGSLHYARQSPSTFVDAYYTTQTWRQIYAEEVMPLPDQCEWNVPSDVSLRIIGTPTNPKQAERPRSKRIFSGYHKI